MAKRRFTKKQVTYTIIGTIAVFTVAIWLFAFFGPSPQTSAPASKDDTANQQPGEDAPAPSDVTRDDVPADEPELTIDPASVARIDIEPLQLSVAYVRGIPGFSFSADRTASGTRYVEFRSDSLIGTKCTGDQGAFASIIVSPSEQDSSTLSKTKKIDGTTYGLSLPDETCTSDAALFAQYQTAFRAAFSLLERMSADTV